MFTLLQWLADARVDYVLAGGLAVTLHGYQRVTMDVDVVLAMDDGNLARFIAGAKAANLHPVNPVPLDSLVNPELRDRWHRESDCDEDWHGARQRRDRYRRTQEDRRSCDMNSEMNLRLLREIEANRAFILAAYQQNPELLARAEPRIRQLFQPLPQVVEPGKAEALPDHLHRSNPPPP